MAKRLWAIFGIAVKRILSQPWMALAGMAGMIFATALSMSVPLYAGSVYNRIFLQSVGAAPVEAGLNTPIKVTPNYPPFSFMFSYDSSLLGNKQWPDLAALNAYLKDQAAPRLGLPVKAYTRYFATDPMALFPGAVKAFPDTEQPLIWASLAMMDQLQQHITLLEGHFPNPSPSGPVEVLVYEDLANQLGLQVGEQYNLFARDQVVDGAKSTVTIPVRVAGIFQAKDPAEDYWFIRASSLKDRLMIPEETFANRISPMLSNEIYTAFWFLVADGSGVRPEQAMQMVARIQKFQQEANQALPSIYLGVSPVNALIEYQRSANLLTVLLFAFSVPIFGLLLAFITMTAGMTVERQRNEIAILRSRGAMVLQMTGIAVAESLILGALTLLVSLPLSAGVAEAIGRTRSFLDFSNPQPLDLRWTPTALYFGLAAVLLSLLARVAPTVAAARDTIVSYKRERSRSLRAPFWQRVGLDFWLMLLAGYGLYQLRQSGSIDVLGASLKGDPFTNPLLLMVPALAIVALSLFFLRLLPLAMRIVAWITAQTQSVGVMMAAAPWPAPPPPIPCPSSCSSSPSASPPSPPRWRAHWITTSTTSSTTARARTPPSPTWAIRQQGAPHRRRLTPPSPRRAAGSSCPSVTTSSCPACWTPPA